MGKIRKNIVILLSDENAHKVGKVNLAFRIAGVTGVVKMCIRLVVQNCRRKTKRSAWELCEFQFECKS